MKEYLIKYPTPSNIHKYEDFVAWRKERDKAEKSFCEERLVPRLKKIFSPAHYDRLIPGLWIVYLDSDSYSYRRISTL